MSLLGTSWDDPKTLAILNLAGGLMANRNAGQGLMQGLQGYQQTLANAEESKWRNSEREYLQAERQRKQREAQEEQQRQAAIKGLLSDAFLPVSGSQAIGLDASGPTAEKASLIGQQKPVNYQQLATQIIGMGGDPSVLKTIAESGNYGKSKVARTIKGMGPDGKEYEYQVDDYGQRVGDGLAQYRAPLIEDMGGQKVALDPYSLQAMAQFKKTMSPDAQASNAVAWANNALSRERLNFDKQGGVDGVNGTGGVKLPPGYMWAAPGQAAPIPGTEQAQKADLAKREKQASIESAQNALQLVDQAIQHPGRTTATGLSSVLDPRNYVPGTAAKDFQAVKDQISGGAFLQAFESLKGGGAITEIEGKKAEQAIARMQTSQSDAAFESALKDYRSVIEGGLRRLNGGAQVQQPSTARTPMLGQVMDGYKFKGGNPADPKNWEKQ
jgi:hypothetical protein